MAVQPNPFMMSNDIVWPEFGAPTEIPPMDIMISRNEPESFVKEGKYSEPTVGQIWPRFG